MSKNKIIDLIVDAASDKILFKLISKDKIYTNEYENCRKNFDKFSVLLMNFLTKKQYSFKKIRNVFINQGPGKISSIRNSIAIAKGIAFAKNIDLYGFLSEHLIDKSVDQLVKIDKKNFTNINLIKPLYSS